MQKGTIVVVAALAAVAGAAMAAGQDTSNWGNTKDEWASDASFAESKAACRRVGEPRIPVADRPTAAETSALKGCDSEKLYYGEGVPVDYVKARKCAIIEADGADDQLFAGSTILMQIYANGYGVKRNPDLATAYACGIDSAPMEYDLRVKALQALKTKPEKIDFCDSITSGLAQGYCAARDSRVSAVGRDATLNALIAGFPPAGRAAWPALKAAFDAYVDAYSSGEIDQSGTGRAAFVIEAEDQTRDQFNKDMGRLGKGQWPSATAADARDADAKLNASYRKALAATAGGDSGTVTSDDVRKTQRAWLTYRDAYLKFAAAAAPGVSRDAVLARLTRLRLAQLDSLSGQ